MICFGCSFDDDHSDHRLVLQTNITLKASPYGKQLYAQDCPRQIRLLEKDEKAKLLMNGQLYVDGGDEVKVGGLQELQLRTDSRTCCVQKHLSNDCLSSKPEQFSSCLFSILKR